MIKANELTKISKMNLQQVKDSPGFKYAIKQIEAEILKASKSGETEISLGMDTMSENHRHPSHAIVTAVREELASNGYIYSEYSIMNPSGNYNSCFKVRW